MNRLAEFQLTDDEVIVNGVDIASNVTAVRYTHVVNEIPRLEVELIGSADVVKGDGVVYVSQPAPDQIIAFLDDVNPTRLNDMILERMGWGSEHVGELTIEVLKELARGS